jgi:hypothetical protein
MSFNRRIAEALRKAGFTLTPWNRNRQLGSSSMVFHFGQCHGLIEADDYRLQIIAITNEKPGNGNFVQAMDTLEAAARRRQLAVEVAAITNGRLRIHLELKRGYRIKPDAEDLTMRLEPAPYVGPLSNKITTHERQPVT